MGIKQHDRELILERMYVYLHVQARRKKMYTFIHAFGCVLASFQLPGRCKVYLYFRLGKTIMRPSAYITPMRAAAGSPFFACRPVLAGSCHPLCFRVPQRQVLAVGKKRGIFVSLLPGESFVSPNVPKPRERQLGILGTNKELQILLGET